jgi:hypothetical protein
MTLESALGLIKEYCDRMNTLYGKVVFDEWVVVGFTGDKERILAYSGPRRDQFKKNFQTDVKALRSELLRIKHPIGDFDFARHAGGTHFDAFMAVGERIFLICNSTNAGGTHFDAFMAVGERIFLICNSTNQSMQAISKDPKWLVAQVPFAELTDKFRADPLIDPS